MKKIEITINHDTCGDGCCSWTEVYATLYEGDEVVIFERQIGNYYMHDDDAQEAALETFDLKREEVEFI